MTTRKTTTAAKPAAPAKRTRTKSTATLTVVPSPVVEAAQAAEIAAMTRAARTAAALDEAKATKAWKDGGEVGEAPARPISDWLEANPDKRGKNAPKQANGSKPVSSGHRKYDENATARLVERITTARATGISFPKLATQMNDETFDGSSDWTGPKLYALACRVGIGQLPLVKPAAKSASES